MTASHDHAWPDDGVVHEWLDGQLDDEHAAQLAALVSSSPAFAERVAEARGLVAASSRILSALDEVPAGVLPRGTRSAADAPVHGARPARREFTWQRWASAAAVLLVAVTGTLMWQATPTTDTVGVSSSMPQVVQVPGPPSGEAVALGAPPTADAASQDAASQDAASQDAPLVSTPPSSARIADAMAPLPENALTAVTPRVAAPSAAMPAAPPQSAGVEAEASSRVESRRAPSRAAASAGRGAPSLTGAPFGASLDAGATSSAARQFGSAELSSDAEMRSDVPLALVAYAVQRVVCEPGCEQRRVELAIDGRVRRWTQSLVGSSPVDTGQVRVEVLTRLSKLVDSLELVTLPANVRLDGAQCRTVGSLRESLRLEFRIEGDLYRRIGLPWCSNGSHPMDIMSRAIEQAAADQLGVRGAP